MLTKSEKAEIVRRYAQDPKNTGSSIVQIAILAKSIDSTQAHLKTHKKDHSSRRGLLKMVGQRNALMNYLKRQDPAAFEKLRSDLESG